MGEARLCQWVKANPGRVNDRDSWGYTPLCVAAADIKSALLVLWLVNEKGADVNTADSDGRTPLHLAGSFDILKILMDCGADPTLLDSIAESPLIGHILCHHADLVARLLQDLRVQASVNVQNATGLTALHLACRSVYRPEVAATVQLLLQTGADLDLLVKQGETLLKFLGRDRPNHPRILALLAQKLNAEKASFLVKARRLVMAASRTTPPSYLQLRVAAGLPVPRVAVASVTNGQNNGEDDEARRQLRTMLAWLVGMEGKDMPRDVFRMVLELLMPFWDPLRRTMKGGAREGQTRSEDEWR